MHSYQHPSVPEDIRVYKQDFMRPFHKAIYGDITSQKSVYKNGTLST